MKLKLSSSKAVGFVLMHNTLKYVLASKTNNKINIEKAETIDIHCKTALQSFQALSKAYPTARGIDSSQGIFSTEAHNIGHKDDLERVLKNKLEGEAPGSQVVLKILEQGGGAVSYFALKKALLPDDIRGVSVDTLFPHILSPLSWFDEEAPYPLLFFSSFGCDVFFSSKKAFSYSASSPTFKMDVLLSAYEALKEAQTKTLKFSGASSPQMNEVLELLESQSSITMKRLTTRLKGAHADYVLEAGLAKVLLDDHYPSFSVKPRSLCSFFKQDKKWIAISLALSLAVLVTQGTLWSIKAKCLHKANQALYSEIIARPLTEKAAKLPEEYQAKHSVSLMQEQLRNSKGKNVPFNLHPATPSVRETLAWIKTVYEKYRKDSNPPFELYGLEYRLVGQPTLKTHKVPYLVKVKMTLKAISPEIARLIHEELLNAHEFIQTEKKVTWIYHNDLYETSFFLKNNRVIHD